MDTAPPRLALAERVVALASSLGVETALIGALALAIHGFVRATQDVDLGTAIQSFDVLRQLEQRLLTDGLRVRMALPDDQDDLGGVLRVWDREDADGEPIEPVEIVNFYNPLKPQPNPGIAAIRTAMPIEPGSSIKVVRLPDLIALKLAAGSLSDLGDVIKLLESNPDADEAEIRETCERYGLAAKLDDLLE